MIASNRPIREKAIVVADQFDVVVEKGLSNWISFASVLSPGWNAFKYYNSKNNSPRQTQQPSRSRIQCWPIEWAHHYHQQQHSSISFIFSSQQHEYFSKLVVLATLDDIDKTLHHSLLFGTDPLLKTILRRLHHHNASFQHLIVFRIATFLYCLSSLEWFTSLTSQLGSQWILVTHTYKSGGRTMWSNLNVLTTKSGQDLSPSISSDFFHLNFFWKEKKVARPQLSQWNNFNLLQEVIF